MADDPLDPYWPTRGAPDANSMCHALRVQCMLADMLNDDDPVEYIMDTYGDTREQAEVIVKNCRVTEE